MFIEYIKDDRDRNVTNLKTQNSWVFKRRPEFDNRRVCKVEDDADQAFLLAQEGSFCRVQEFESRNELASFLAMVDSFPDPVFSVILPVVEAHITASVSEEIAGLKKELGTLKARVTQLSKKNQGANVKTNEAKTENPADKSLSEE